MAFCRSSNPWLLVLVLVLVLVPDVEARQGKTYGTGPSQASKLQPPGMKIWTKALVGSALQDSRSTGLSVHHLFFPKTKMGDAGTTSYSPDTLTPIFDPDEGSSLPESPSTQKTITALSLSPHMEGGYYVQTHINPLLIPTPFPKHPASASQTHSERDSSFDPAYRCLHTSIFYYLTPTRPRGAFHRNRCAIVHSLHKGRGVYVIIHPSETPGESRVETYVVGHDIGAGERLQWTVDGGTYKASFLLPDNPEDTATGDEARSGSLLITEVAVPGFEFYDHDFLTREKLLELVGEETAKGLEWLLRGPWDEVPG